MKTNRYYKFWDKALAKREKKTFIHWQDLSMIATQIERSYHMNMITIEQCTELLGRYKALEARLVRSY